MQNGHDAAVDDVGDLVAAGDDVQLVPVVDLENLHQRVGVAKRADEPRPSAGRRADDPAAPGDFAAFRSAVLDVAGHQPVVVIVEPGTVERPPRIARNSRQGSAGARRGGGGGLSGASAAGRLRSIALR